VDDLRAKLDAASLLPRGRWKELWLAAAEEFCAPAKPFVERALADETLEGAAAALNFLENPAGPLPLASWRAWRDAFAPWRKLNGGRGDPAKARALVDSIKQTTDAERVVPLMLGALSQDWSVRYAMERAKWHGAHPLAVSTLVSCVRLEGHDELRDHAFFSLGRVKDLPSEARGALWMVVWAERTPRWRWETLARLREPAAVAASLADAIDSTEAFEPRPALTRALLRIVAREDPWLELPRDADDPSAPKVDEVVARALAWLPRVAELTGLEAQAREALDPRWAALGVDGAVARGLLGGVDAVPALIAALAGERSERALEALTRLGAAAKSALDAVRATADSEARSLALAALDPTPDALEALVPICERRIAQAGERRDQYEEGLITAGEYARWFDAADVAVRLWNTHGTTPQRQDVQRRLAQALDAHGAIHHDVAIARLRGAAAT
jgi:hypothetical protein